MKPNALIVALIPGWLSFAFMQPAWVPDGVRLLGATDDRPKPAAPGHAEKDPRLHADGKGWRVDRAKIVAPKRPRVLLIGDSILNGYLE
jgi:hypothetical protein